ncbi:MAG TPA: hypothetical protein VJK54_11240 [Chthoniobacterales bacterium]|nr:hypothetical protein [Chthoniobacterales bacterium]
MKPIFSLFLALLVTLISSASFENLIAQNENRLESEILEREGTKINFATPTVVLTLTQNNSKVDYLPQLMMDPAIAEKTFEKGLGVLEEKIPLAETSTACSSSQIAERLTKITNQIEAAKKREKEECNFSESKYNLQLVPIRPVGRITKGNTTAIQALSICCEKWLAETGAVTELDQILSDYVIDVVKRGADHRLVKAFEKYRNNVIKAHELGDDPLALVCIQVAEDIQQAIEDSIKISETAQEKFEFNFWDPSYTLSDAWNNTMKATMKTAKYRAKYIEASILSQNQKITNNLKKVVEISQFVTQKLRKAVVEILSVKDIEDKKERDNRFKKIANFMKESMYHLGQNIAFLEKSNIVNIAFIEEQNDESIFLEKIANQHQSLAWCYSRAANARIKCVDKIDSFYNYLDNADALLEEASMNLKEALQAMRMGIKEDAKSWLKDSELHQARAACYYSHYQ